MTSRFITCGCFLALLAPAIAQGQTAIPVNQVTPATPIERLALDTAVQLAVDNNRQLKSAMLQVENAGDQIAIARSRRLPSFDTEVNASQLLSPVTFSFPKGAFGDFPGTGPIPSTDSTISVPRQPTMYVSSSVSQPLTQLVRLNIGVRNAVATEAIERERARGQQLSVVNNVKRLYFSILQTESALTATNEAIALYRELDRTLTVRVAQKVALRADELQVQYQLAQQELALTTRQNTLQSQKEQLNVLLGRDVRTPFEVANVSEISLLDIDLEAAVRHALDRQPDLREARLKADQADLDRQLTRAGRIPDVSLALAYNSNFNIDVLPTNLASFGVQVKWEPFDWGRRGRELASKTRTVSQARLNVREVEDRTVVNINSLFRTLSERRAQLRVAQMAQTAAREKARVKTNQYQVQAALLPDVLQVRAEVADTDDRLQQALLAFWTAKADFELAIGEGVIR